MRTSNKSIIYYPEILPSAYQEVEYLESNGTEWIDTGIDSGNGIEVETTVLCLSQGESNPQIFGSYNGSTRQSVAIVAGNWQFSFGSYENIPIPFNTNTWYKLKAYWKTNDCGIYVDDSLIFSTSTTISANGLTMSLFARKRTSTTVDKWIVGRLKVFTIKQDNTLVRNFIPARRKSDSVLGMYDLVTNTFFTNRGTGTFTAGADVYHSVSSRKSIVPCKVLPDGYKRLEYIQSSGTQYIDTGVVPSLNFKFNAKLSYSVIPENNVFCGVYSPYFILLRSNNSMQARLNNSWAILNISDFNINKIYDVETFISDNNIYALCNGETQSVIPSTTTLSQYSIYLFCCNNNNSQYKNVSAKAYNVKFTINNSLIRNFIPSQRLSDNAVGMYDTVTNTFFENQGTGSFIAGPEISNYDYISSNKQIIYENSN